MAGTIDIPVMHIPRRRSTTNETNTRHIVRRHSTHVMTVGRRSTDRQIKKRPRLKRIAALICVTRNRAIPGPHKRSTISHLNIRKDHRHRKHHNTANDKRRSSKQPTAAD